MAEGFKKICSVYKNEKKYIHLSILCGFLFTVVVGVATSIYAERVQSDIAKEVIRFHVKANSDTEFDQTLKVAVKDKILDEFQDELNEANTIEESREILFLSMESIKKCAEEEVQRRGYDYPVSVELTQAFFPTKVYGDIAIPAGEYEALRVNIGEAKGQNWWCVMYPPLCYVDITQDTLSNETKQKLANSLSEDEYNLITLKQGNQNESEEIDIKVKFKIVEWWQTQKYKQQQYVSK